MEVTGTAAPVIGDPEIRFRFCCGSFSRTPATGQSLAGRRQRTILRHWGVLWTDGTNTEGRGGVHRPTNSVWRAFPAYLSPLARRRVSNANFRNRDFRRIVYRTRTPSSHVLCARRSSTEREGGWVSRSLRGGFRVLRHRIKYKSETTRVWPHTKKMGTLWARIVERVLPAGSRERLVWTIERQ